jgi:putative nucleotidyltransferase with HDIG domain
MHDMCNVIVEAGGYRMAWIGLAQADDAQTVRPVAWAGDGTDYLKELRVSVADAAQGDGSCAAAIHTGLPQVVQNLPLVPHLSATLVEAKRRGFAASATFPLTVKARTAGVLTIYAAEPDAFNPDEVNLLTEMAEDLAYGLGALNDRAEREAAVERLRKSLEATVAALASVVELRDAYTAGHQRRVSDLAVAIARAMGLSETKIHGLFLAAVLHDIGKIQVPAEILTKPGKLTSVEFQLIQAHSEAGASIVQGVDFPWPIADIVRQHHERLDGSGYPNRLEGDAIIDEAKILAVADVVEAMMSHRPYRAALGIDAALDEIAKGRGVRYDAAAVDACVALFREKGFKFQ